MRKEARILYVYNPENTSARTFVEALRKALAGWDITLGAPGLMTRLFEVRKYNVVHVFHGPDAGEAKFVKALPDSVRKVQTLLGPPADEDDYRNLIVGHRATVFSRKDRDAAGKVVPGVPIECIPPFAALPDVNMLQPSSTIRQMFEVGDRFMVVALSDVSCKEDFDSFIYVIREFERRREFRFLVPRYRKDKDTQLWRERLQARANEEKLKSTLFLNDDVDLHSLLDSADIAMHLGKKRDTTFDFSLQVLDAVALGKPTLCFDRPPYNETLKEFVPAWSCVNVEDFVREARNLVKSANRMEQISTEVARFARDRFNVEKIAEQYRSLYEAVLKRS